MKDQFRWSDLEGIPQSRSSRRIRQTDLWKTNRQEFYDSPALGDRPRMIRMRPPGSVRLGTIVTCIFHQFDAWRSSWSAFCPFGNTAHARVLFSRGNVNVNNSLRGATARAHTTSAAPLNRLVNSS